MFTTVAEGAALFARGALDNYLEIRRGLAARAVERFMHDRAGNAQADRICRDMVVAFEMDQVCFHPEGLDLSVHDCDVDVALDFERPFADRTQPCYVHGTEFRLSFRFSGDPDVFYYCPTTEMLTHPRGLVEPGRLILRIQQPNDRLDRVEALRVGYEQYCLVKQFLQAGEGQIQSYNRALNLAVEERLEARVQTIHLSSEQLLDMKSRNRRDVQA
jgi:hypothetical protein